MDSLKRRILILGTSFLLLIALVAQTQEQASQQQPTSEVSEVQKQETSPQEPANQTPPVNENANAAALQPLKVKSTVRAHGNIHLPQDI